MLVICLNALKGQQFVYRLSIVGGCRARNLKTCSGYRNAFFGRYLIWTNVVGSGILMSVGDLIGQQIETARKTDKHVLDWNRNMKMTSLGSLQGLVSHFFYKVLETHLPGVKLSTVAKKVVLDQTILSPICLLILFSGLELMGNRDFKAFTSEIKEKFGYVFAIDCAIWTPAQVINFSLLPAKYTVTYVNILTMLYNVLLSFIIHN